MSKTLELQVFESISANDNDIDDIDSLPPDSMPPDRDNNLNDIPSDMQLELDSRHEDSDNTFDGNKENVDDISTSKRNLFSESGKSYKNFPIFESIQKWKGYVTEVYDDGFEARLIDLTNDGTDETAKFSYHDISESERNSLEIGKTFYWSIGRREYLGQVEKISRIHFQKIIKWDMDFVDRVKNKVDMYLNLL